MKKMLHTADVKENSDKFENKISKGEIMQTLESNNLIDSLSQEFNGYSIYGVELVLDELADHAKNDSTIESTKDNTDWFGLSDLSI